MGRVHGDAHRLSGPFRLAGGGEEGLPVELAPVHADHLNNSSKYH